VLILAFERATRDVSPDRRLWARPPTIAVGMHVLRPPSLRAAQDFRCPKAPPRQALGYLADQNHEIRNADACCSEAELNYIARLDPGGKPTSKVAGFRLSATARSKA